MSDTSILDTPAAASTATLEALRQLVIKDFFIEPSVLRDDAPFTELGLDSLGMVDFVFKAEDLFGVQIDYELAAKHPTLERFAVLVDTLKAHQAMPAAA